MSDKAEIILARVRDEAWSEYVYPRSAVGDLAEPNPQSGFMRAARVFEQWTSRWARAAVAAELDERAAALDEQAEALGSPRMDTSASGMVIILRDIASDLRARAAELRQSGGRS